MCPFYNTVAHTKFLRLTCFFRYLVGANTITDQIVFVFGPVSTAVSEVVCVRRSGLLDAIPPNTKIIADGGFRGLEKVAIPYPWREVKSETDIERRVGKKNCITGV